MTHLPKLILVWLVSCFSSVLAQDIPALPEAVTNNAVATVYVDDKQYLLSFMGLAEGKSYKDVHNKAWQLTIDKQGLPGEWKSVPSVPSSLTLKGRLASVAAGVGASIYLFGGYTVDQEHNEISTPDVYKYSPITESYKLLTPMPVPVDDAVALVYQNRFIYLISGWHNDGNVNLVQVYDVDNNTWQQASPFLGKPVFGHAGGIVGKTMVICDGVAVVPRKARRRTFAAEAACYKGVINPDNHLKVDWHILQHPTGVARYRMAAAGDEQNQRILFIGGSDNPYNYNGIGYNGAPSEPDAKIWSFDIHSGEWAITESNTATMDHRGLVKVGNKWITMGGMTTKQKVSAVVAVHL